MNIPTDLSADHGLTYKRQGKGFPLVLLHGYLGGAALWDEQLATFSKKFDVIVPELAGYGGNTKQQSSESIEGHAQQVLAFLSHIGVDQFHLVGHSMGGMIAQEMASQAPDRIDRLVCYGTGPQGVMPDRFETLETSRQRVRTEGLPATAKRIAATWFAKGAKAKGYPICVQLGRDVSLETALAGLTAMERWDGRGSLADIKRPTLVIWGDGDQSYGWPQPEALWRGIKGSHLGVLPGCGHNAHMEQPEIFNAIVENFLPENV